MKQKLTLGIIATITTPATIVALWHMLAPESACWLTNQQMVGCMVTAFLGNALFLIMLIAPEFLFDVKEY